MRGEVIWNNIYTSSPRQILDTKRWNKWVSAGIILVDHLCHSSENRLLGQEEIHQKFGITSNFLDALVIRSSIPHSWRNMLTANYKQDVDRKYTILLNQQTFNILQTSPKSWYAELVKRQQLPIKRQESWAAELEIDGGKHPLDWPNIYSRPYKTTRETKMQSFSFKLAHRLVPCNSYLSKIRIKDQATCSFCEEEDTITHFYINCPCAKVFWGKLSEWCERHIDLPLSTLSVTERLFGTNEPIRNTSQRVVNWLVLQAKFYVQKRKLFFRADLSLLAFLAEIRSYLATEKTVCYMENKPTKFRQWERIFSALK